MCARVVLHMVCKAGVDVLNPPSPSFDAYIVCGSPRSINEGLINQDNTPMNQIMLYVDSRCLFDPA